MLSTPKRLRLFSLAEIAFIFLLAIVPLFTSFPYRVNIFLSWEGAYRLSLGQVPYRDFGMPMGYMYWVIPAVFFKIFGTPMITLVKAQVFINIISGLAFRSILKSLGVQPGIRLAGVVLYCISYSFFNFWPWYNHTVIVYEIIGLAFLLRYIAADEKKWILLSLSALFIFFSFFTKQDGGALALVLALALLVYDGFSTRQWRPLLIFGVSYLISAFAIIAPLTRFHFGYWFNHGQPPHTARLSIAEILDEFLMGSQWIKFYLVMVVLLSIAYFRKFNDLVTRRRPALFLILTLGILAEAAILQVTSYTPPDNNIFFHSFAFVFILSIFSDLVPLDLSKWKPLMAMLAVMLLWWSGVYWKYFQRLTSAFQPTTERVSPTGENIVNRRTYILPRDTSEIPMSEWTYTGLHSFEKINMPKPTAEGIARLLQMHGIKGRSDLKVLNMSELTPLAVEMPYTTETGPDIPLWYHLGVSMFNRQAEQYEKKIAAHYYDVALFEYIPSLNNFYPFRIRDSLRLHYSLVDSFEAPRRGDTRGWIEIYRKP